MSAPTPTSPDTIPVNQTGFFAVPYGLDMDADPAQIVHVLYTSLLSNWLDNASTQLEQYKRMTAAAPAVGRNPIIEEKVRLIILSAAQLWLFLIRDPVTQAFLIRLVGVCADPAQWAVLANLIWGPV